MKIPDLSRAAKRNSRDGMAVIVVLILLGLILAFICANMHTLSELRGEMKLIEQKQLRRLGYNATNAVPQSTVATTTNSQPGAQPAPPPNK
jgi:hypothetical protein